jgi:hypothetical protein
VGVKRLLLGRYDSTGGEENQSFVLGVVGAKLGRRGARGLPAKNLESKIK